MKKALLCALTLIAFLSCSEFDDSAIQERLKNHEERISKLETLCNQMNTNISSLQTIVSALQNNDYVTNVSPITENGKAIGYVITFSKSGSITIYHGKDGKDGADGQDGKDGVDGADGKDGLNGTDGKDGIDGTDGKDGIDGTDGKDGADGKDGVTPVIGVKQDSDGVYYWTLNGDWLLDDSGNKIPAVGKDGQDGKDGVDGTNGKDGVNGTDGKDGVDGTDGKDGQNGKDGADGKDGITPQLKIEEGYWYISYDSGNSWERLGKAAGEDGKDGENGEDGDSFFEDVTQDEVAVYFTLKDGTVISVPKKRISGVDINFEMLEITILPGGYVDLPYTISDEYADYWPTIVTLYEKDYLSVGDFRTSTHSGYLRITLLEKSNFYPTCAILVSVTNVAGNQALKVLTIDRGFLSPGDGVDYYECDASGGTLDVKVSIYSSVVSNNISSYNLEIPSTCNWIKPVPVTKAVSMRTEVCSLSIEENYRNYRRSAYVYLCNNCGDRLDSIQVVQRAARVPSKICNGELVAMRHGKGEIKILFDSPVVESSSVSFGYDADEVDRYNVAHGTSYLAPDASRVKIVPYGISADGCEGSVGFEIDWADKPYDDGSKFLLPITYCVEEGMTVRSSGIVYIECMKTLAGNWSVDEITPMYPAAVLSGWGELVGTTIWLADGTTPVNKVTKPASDANHKYVLIYGGKWTDGLLYFDIDFANEMTDKPGCYPIINMQDRVWYGVPGGYDTVTPYNCYFDSNKEGFIWDFTILGWWGPGGEGGTPLEDPSHVPGWAKYGWMHSLE